MKKDNDFLKKINFENRTHFTVFIFFVIISRLPLLNLGFGYDIDGWVEVNFGFNTIKNLVYLPSRGLGHPLYELFLSLLLKIAEIVSVNTWLVTNSFSLIYLIISLYLFYRILTLWGVDGKDVLILFYPFVPVIWKNSTMTVDFSFSLMFILLAHYLLLKGKYDLSALILGFAAGSRFQNGIILIPFIYLLLQRCSWKLTKAFRYFFIFSSVTFVFLIPFLVNYGTSIAERYESVANLESTPFMYLLKAGFRGVYRFIGIDAALFLFLFVLFSKDGLKKIIALLKSRDESTVFCLFTFLLFLSLFVKFPYKQEYMLPLVPYSLILLNRLFNKRLFYLFLIIIVINGFIAFPSVKVEYTPKGRIYPVIKPVGNGTLLEDVEKREALLRVNNFVESGKVKSHSIVVWHRYQMPYVFFNRNKIYREGDFKIEDKKLLPLESVYDKEKDIYFTNTGAVAGKKGDDLREIYSDRNIYYIPCAISIAENQAGINILDYNLILINELKPNEY